MTRTIKRAELVKKLGGFRSVENCDSRNGMNKAPNQFVIGFDNGEVFQSYRSLICAKIDGQYYFTDKHDYSTTTSRFCNQFCGYSLNERRKGIADGTFVLIVD